MHKFIVLNIPKNPNSTTTPIEVLLSHADDVVELNKVQFNTELSEEESTVSTDNSTVSSQLNAYKEQVANEAVTTNDKIETNVHQSSKNISMCSKNILHGSLNE